MSATPPVTPTPHTTTPKSNPIPKSNLQLLLFLFLAAVIGGIIGVVYTISFAKVGTKTEHPSPKPSIYDANGKLTIVFGDTSKESKIEEVADFYESAWQKLLITAALFGLAVPLALQVYQSMMLRHDRKEIKEDFQATLEAKLEEYKAKLDETKTTFETTLADIKTQAETSVNGHITLSTTRINDNLNSNNTVINNSQKTIELSSRLADIGIRSTRNFISIATIYLLNETRYQQEISKTQPHPRDNTTQKEHKTHQRQRWTKEKELRDSDFQSLHELHYNITSMIGKLSLQDRAATRIHEYVIKLPQIFKHIKAKKDASNDVTDISTPCLYALMTLCELTETFLPIDEYKDITTTLLQNALALNEILREYGNDYAPRLKTAYEAKFGPLP